MTASRLLLTVVPIGVLVGLLEIAQVMNTNSSEQHEALPMSAVLKES